MVALYSDANKLIFSELISKTNHPPTKINHYSHMSHMLNLSLSFCAEISGETYLEETPVGCSLQFGPLDVLVCHFGGSL